MQISEINDGRYIGLDVIEITAFPALNTNANNVKDYVKKTAEMFKSSLFEFYNYSKNRDICSEIILITEDANNQTFESYIHVFYVLRSISSSPNKVENDLNELINSFSSILKAGNYAFNCKCEKILYDLLEGINQENAVAIVKSEKISGNIYSPYPYYYCSVLPADNIDNFEILISSLGQTRNVCVSFQILPTYFSQQEAFFINEQVAELRRIAAGFKVGDQSVKDTTADEPARVLDYYSSNNQNGLFRYNILVFGKKGDCASISSRLMSLLQAGKDKRVPYDCIGIDISQEKIHLKQEFIYYPWNINNKLMYAYRNNKVINAYLNIKTLKRLPYLMTTDEVVAFFRLPMYDAKMSAIKENRVENVSEQFEETVTLKDNIIFGHLVSDENVQIGCPESGFTKHMLIVGMPGSGKTTFSINLLLQFEKRNIPFLVVEPTKSEYRAMIDVIPDLQIFTPGNNEVSPFIINPFIPPEGIRIEQYIPGLASAFEAAFSMPSPLDILFLRAIRNCYTENGWKDYSKLGDPDVKTFGLREFIICFRKIIKSSNYSPEIKGNLESAGVFRLMNLIEQNSNIYDTIPTIPIKELLQKPTIIELNAIENSEQKALIMALLLINICIYTKNSQAGDGKLKNIFMLDEAHVLLSGGSSKGDVEADSQGTTIKALQDMIAEIRAYGTGIIIADQSPVKVSREIVANTDLKAAFRLVQSLEKSVISDTTNMSEDEEKKLSRLHTGEAYVYYSSMEAARQIKTEDIRHKENIRLVVPNDEIKDRMTYWNTRSVLLRPYKECDYCKECNNDCDFRTRSQAEYYALRLYQKNLSKLKEKKDIILYMTKFPELMDIVVKDISPERKNRIVDCTRVKFIKYLEMRHMLTLSDQEKELIFSKVQR